MTEDILAQYGIKPKKMWTVPLNDELGMSTGKIIQILEGSQIHKLIMTMYGGSDTFPKIIDLRILDKRKI
jgi:hypothetical protein